MPFKKGDTPKPLDGKNIPRKFIDKFIDAFNAEYDKSQDEASAYQAAFGVMTKALHKAGYRQGKDETWHKITRRKESQESPFVPFLPSKSVVMEEKSLESALVEGLRYEAVALIDHAVSQQGSGHERYYSPEFNDRCLKRTNEYLEQGHVVTIYNSHGSALGSAFSVGSDKNPIGKVEKVWRQGDSIRYRGFISATDEGKDVIRLMYDGIRNETSVRIYDVEAEIKELESEEPSELIVMQEGYIGGIDFCDEAGIPGAGLVQILESAPTFLTQMEDDMDYSDITIEELREQRPDIVEALSEADRTSVEALTEKVAELQQALAQAEQATELAAAQELVQALQAEKEALEAELTYHRAAEGLVGREIVKRLLEEKPADPEARALELRDEALTQLMAESGKTSAKGQTRFEDEDDVEDVTAKQPFAEDLFAKVLGLAEGVR